ncbi:MAG TPA: cation:proton antiporter regulatory subunit [Acidimicrobiales bacterium]|nr:cation:proton antiporter regulatory subunit [Acidimicrobiales bacterium]
MPEVTETPLPGVGVRHEFTTSAGERVAVLFHRSGRRELVVYDADDPDTGRTVLHLDPDDTRTLAELLGATQVSEALTAVQQQLEGLAIEWITVPVRSRFAGATIAEGEFRTRTGTSIVAVVRGDSTIPAPGPDHRFVPGDVAVAVGTPEGLAQLRELLVT